MLNGDTPFERSRRPQIRGYVKRGRNCHPFPSYCMPCTWIQQIMHRRSRRECFAVVKMMPNRGAEPGEGWRASGNTDEFARDWPQHNAGTNAPTNRNRNTCTTTQTNRPPGEEIQINRQTDTFTDQQPDGQTDRLTSRQTDWKVSKQTGNEVFKLTRKQTDKHKH